MFVEQGKAFCWVPFFALHSYLAIELKNSIKVIAHTSCPIKIGSWMIKKCFLLEWIFFGGLERKNSLGEYLWVQKLHRNKWNNRPWKSFREHVGICGIMMLEPPTYYYEHILTCSGRNRTQVSKFSKVTMYVTRKEKSKEGSHFSQLYKHNKDTSPFLFLISFHYGKFQTYTKENSKIKPYIHCTASTIINIWPTSHQPLWCKKKASEFTFK